MTTKLRAAVAALAGLTILGLALTATAGAHPTDFARDPVSTVGHVCDQWGLHNDWGTHQHGDYWGDHPHHDGTAGHHHNDGGPHRGEPHHDGPTGPHGGPHSGPHGQHHGY
ncbi:hypothetical protein [Halorussus ruber]|uniref:hypothetical protein n=1 Tax=Halorussus ruber TaxID=1126238 RepID=UPI001092F606|nr:hypothetical protein [Halorussus ruber]